MARTRRDEDAVLGGDGDAIRVGREPHAAAQLRKLALAPGNRLRLGLRPLGRGQRLVERVDPGEQPAELEAAEDLLQRRAVRRARDEVARIAVELEIAAHRREDLRGARLLGVLLERPAASRGQLLHVLEHAIDRPVLCDQLAGGLVADPRYAGDVVARVPLEPDEVGHLVGAHAVAQLDPLRRVHVDIRDSTRRHHQADVLGDELERVAVGRDDARLDGRLVGARGERRDHVVRLPALELEVPVPERLDDRPEVRELLAQEVRHPAAIGLVLGRDLGAVHRPRIPRDRDPAGRVVGEELEQHVREAEERVRGLPVRRLKLLREREERAVGEVVAVDEEELGVAHGRVVELELLACQRLRHASTVFPGLAWIAACGAFRSFRARGSSSSRRTRMTSCCVRLRRRSRCSTSREPCATRSASRSRALRSPSS